MADDDKLESPIAEEGSGKLISDDVSSVGLDVSSIQEMRFSNDGGRLFAEGVTITLKQAPIWGGQTSRIRKLADTLGDQGVLVTFETGYFEPLQLTLEQRAVNGSYQRALREREPANPVQWPVRKPRGGRRAGV